MVLYIDEISRCDEVAKLSIMLLVDYLQSYGRAHAHILWHELSQTLSMQSRRKADSRGHRVVW